MPQAGGALAGLHCDVLPQAKSPAPGPETRRVLIVDDSKFVRTTFRSILSGSFAVREEADGEAAWDALLADASIAAVLTDLDMPKLDGFELLARIRGAGDARLRELPVVIISGNEQPETKERARRAGASDFISKSADAPEVLARVDNLLRLVKAVRRATDDPDATGVLTPHALTAEGRKLYANARRHGNELSLMALHIENLAEVERRTGREATHELLGRVAKLLLGSLRAGDSLGRAAPGTFLVVAPGTAVAPMLALARRLREQLESAQIRYDGQALRLACRFGVASLGQDGRAAAIEDLIRIALQRTHAPARPAPPPASAAPGLDAELERALRVLEAASAARLGDRRDDILKRLETIAKRLRARQQ